MKKAELIKQMAIEADISIAEAKIALNSIYKHIRRTLGKEKGKVTLVGFGTFSLVKRKERIGRNPQTGKSIIIKEQKVVKFKAGKKLNNSIGGGTGDTGPRRK